LIETHFPNRERIRAGRVSAFNGRSYQNYPTVQNCNMSLDVTRSNDEF